MARLFRVLISLLITTVVYSQEDWANCTPCRCAWVNGRKHADCRKNESVILNQIPKNLSSEIRSIDFTDQDLYRLERYVFQQAHLEDLQKIKLVHCKLHEIDKNAFRNMSLMIELDLSNNLLESLDPETFKTNQRLRNVYLNENSIKELKDGLFYNLTHLQKVELKKNQIHTIGIDTFYRNDKLQYLLLDDNRLINLSRSLIERLEKSLSYVSLNDNPWKCDCHLKDFRDFVVKRNLLTSVATCAEPERLKGRSWALLESSDFACRPVIKYPPNSLMEIDANDNNVTLYCKVSGDPAPDVNWLFKNSIIDVNPHRPSGKRYSLVHSQVEESTYWYNLTIHKINYMDSGIYK